MQRCVKKSEGFFFLCLSENTVQSTHYSTQSAESFSLPLIYILLPCAISHLIPLFCIDSWTALKRRATPPYHRSLSSAPVCHLQHHHPHTQVTHTHTQADTEFILPLRCSYMCVCVCVCVCRYPGALRDQAECV